MKSDEARVIAARQARDAARSALDGRVAQVKADLDARGVGGRIADRVGEELAEAADLALDVARESKAIVAATAGALALWFFREPIAVWFKRRFGGGEEE